MWIFTLPKIIYRASMENMIKGITATMFAMIDSNVVSQMIKRSGYNLKNIRKLSETADKLCEQKCLNQQHILYYLNV